MADHNHDDLEDLLEHLRARLSRLEREVSDLASDLGRETRERADDIRRLDGEIGQLRR